VSDIDNLILEYLRAIRADLATVKEDTRDIKSRLTSVETDIASLKRDNAQRPRLPT
jgi:hypothetical protein